MKIRRDPTGEGRRSTARGEEPRRAAIERTTSAGSRACVRRANETGPLRRGRARV